MKLNLGYLTKKKDACFGIRILTPVSKLNEVGHECNDEVMEKQAICTVCRDNKKICGPYEVHLDQEESVFCPACKTVMITSQELRKWRDDVDAVIEKSDIVSFQRPTDISQLRLMKRVKAMGKPVIQVCDDNYLDVPLSNPGYKYYTQRKEIILETLRVCDAIDVTTPALKELYLRYCPNVEILPNSIDLELLKVTPPLQDVMLYGKDGRRVAWSDFQERRKGKKVILWGGSPTHEEDLEIVVETIRRISRSRNDVIFAFVGYVHRKILEMVPIDKIYLFSLVPNSVYFMLYKAINADVGLAPVAQNQFNRGKSANKLVEYGALRMMGVASDFVTYKGALPRAIYAGYSDREWYEAINRALNCSDREERINENYQWIQEHWDIAKTYKMWESYYQSVLERYGK